MHPISSDFSLIYPYKYLPIMLDGVLLGYVDPKMAPELVRSLRALKIQQNNSIEHHESVPKTLEVAYLPPTSNSEVEEEVNPENDEQSSKNKQILPWYFPSFHCCSLREASQKSGSRRY